jgi:hypothetical protein
MEKKYEDIDGFECNLREMIQHEPEWVESRFKHMEAEVNKWKSLAMQQDLAIAAVANDELYECMCGNEPYTDGEDCPKCFSVHARDQLNEYWDKK